MAVVWFMRLLVLVNYVVAVFVSVGGRYDKATYFVLSAILMFMALNYMESRIEDDTDERGEEAC